MLILKEIITGKRPLFCKRTVSKTYTNREYDQSAQADFATVGANSFAGPSNKKRADWIIQPALFDVMKISYYSLKLIK